MKSIKYIITPALAAFLFTACNNDVKGPSQADIDTQVEAKVKAATDQLKADCDSRIMQAAQMKADSILANTQSAGKVETPAAKNNTSSSTNTSAPATNSTPKAEPSKTVQGGGLRTQSDNAKAKDKNAVEGGGLRSQSDASKAKDNKAVEGGGLRSQSDKNIEKK
jgi:hypothetical protein